jgi:uncharacterized protein YdhG (YjbR/CyaY superfamily)
MKNLKMETIDEYIAAQPIEKRASLEKIRSIIQKAAPKATEVISYGMPAFKQDGILVYFAAFKNHYGFFPTASPIVIFKKELVTYKTSKGAIQFPTDKPIPIKLIQAIVKLRITQNKEKTAFKTGKK